MSFIVIFTQLQKLDSKEDLSRLVFCVTAKQHFQKNFGRFYIFHSYSQLHLVLFNSLSRNQSINKLISFSISSTTCRFSTRFAIVVPRFSTLDPHENRGSMIESRIKTQRDCQLNLAWYGSFRITKQRCHMVSGCYH